MKRWAANLICAFVWNTKKRDKLRTKLRFDTKWCVKFVYDYISAENITNISTCVGYGCRNYIIIVNNKFVFKFPIRDKTGVESLTEKRITDYFSNISPIKIPKMDVIEYNGRYIKKYDYICGATLGDLDKNIVEKYADKLTSQIADFLFVLSVNNPKCLDDLKPIHATKCGFMYGWGHCDIGENFIIDKNTMDIVGFIDWECATFGDLMPDFRNAVHRWNKLGFENFGITVLQKYSEKYIEYIKSYKEL